MCCEGIVACCVVGWCVALPTCTDGVAGCVQHSTPVFEGQFGEPGVQVFLEFVPLGAQTRVARAPEG